MLTDLNQYIESLLLQQTIGILLAYLPEPSLQPRHLLPRLINLPHVLHLTHIIQFDDFELFEFLGEDAVGVEIGVHLSAHAGVVLFEGLQLALHLVVHGVFDAGQEALPDFGADELVVGCGLAAGVFV